MDYYLFDETAGKDEIRIIGATPAPKKSLYAGKSIRSDEIKMKLIYPKSNRKFTDLLGCYYLVVSEKLKKIIENCEPDYTEFFELTLYEENSSNIKKGYYLLNILNNIDAFDLQKSVFEAYSDGKGVSEVEKLVLLENMIGNRTIFRVNLIQTSVFVSEKLKKIIEQEGVTGVNFTDIEEFKEGIFF